MTQHIDSHRRRASTAWRAIGAAAALTMVATAAGAISASSPPASEPAATGLPIASDISHLDVDGDGTLLFGVATPGPRDDGAYYEALVSMVVEMAAANDFPEPIIVDNVPAAEAATALENLAQQNVDVLIVGASEIGDPMSELAETYSDIFWFCSCGQITFPNEEFYASAMDDASEVNYTGGVATGLLLEESGGDTVSFIGCCDLGFEVESFLAFELGVQAVDPSFEAVYVPTGSFNDIATATEAFNNAVSAGTDAIYPYLGGAHEALVQLSNEAGLITMSSGASDACEREDLDYQIAIRFDGGDYLNTIFREIFAGDFTEGMVRTFHVGVDPEPGAVICDPTPEQEAAMDEANALVASGDLAEQFGAIKQEAYGG